MPFTIEEFLAVMEAYNISVWPMQIILNLFAVVALLFLISGRKGKSGIINAVLIFLWLWMGIVYHLMYFTEINTAAYLFGALFILQGLIFIYSGFLRLNALKYRFYRNFRGFLGMLFLLYALIIYPILSNEFGHSYPATPTFGLPCPTTIFTFGILLFSVRKVSWYVILIPFLWSLVGFAAAIQLDMREDYGLVIAGLIGTITLLFTKENQPEEPIIQGDNSATSGFLF
ncbi:MAG TPA: DUF6064 family protein [Gillisia sp.]|nr:DUF6064 family protein [Gillisia sp.]